MTKEKILVSSAAKLFKGYTEDLTEGGVIGVLSGGEEYEPIWKSAGDASTMNTTEKNVIAEDGNSLQLSSNDKSTLTNPDDADRSKAAAVLWAYLGRVGLGDKTLNQRKYTIT